MSDVPLRKYKRLLLKLSGEALMGDREYGIDPDYLRRVAGEIKALVTLGYEIAIVIGGGNIFRGVRLAETGIDRVAGDYIGMLATVMNSLSLQDALERQGVFCRVMSALKINEVCEDYIRRRAVRHLQKGRVVVFAAGTGNPFFTTDTAASLRAAEINADIIFKATRVDGIYSADPLHNQDAQRYDRISYEQVLNDNLQVMDTTAIVMCRDHGIPLCIFNLNNEGDLIRAVNNEPVGSIVGGGAND